MRYLTLTKGKMADNGKIVPRKTTEDDSTTTTPTCTKTLVVSLNNINPPPITVTPPPALQQKMSEDSANSGVVLDETTGLLRALLAGVGKDKIPESLQILTPLAASNSETETEEIMTEVPAEETVDTEEYFQVVESDLVAENVEIANDPSETEREPSETEREPSETEREPSETEREPSEIERELSETEKEPSEAEKEISESEKECSDAAEKEPSETMEVEIDPETAPLGEPSDDSAAEESTLMNIKGLKIVDLLHKDQLDKTNSLADTHIVCEDGHVPFHRYILMAASGWINEILINEDPSELAVIHIPDVKVANVVQVLCILYSGKALYKKSDEGHIYKIFQMLGVGTEGLQFRNSKPEDGSILGKLRFYEKELESEEEEFIPNILPIDSPEIPMIEANVENDVGAEMIEENIVQHDEVEEDRGPRVVSKSQIDKAETAKFMSIKMEMSEDEDAIIQTGYKIKCRYCDLVYTSEESLSEHLSSSCGSHLLGKYSYANKQCLGCRGRFPSYNLYGLINHVESCKRLEVAFSATASQFVNGNLPPVTVKEENLDQLDEMGNEIYPHGSNSGAKAKEGPSTGEEPKRRGRKRGQKNRGKKRGAKRKAAIQIVDVRHLSEKEDEGDQNVEENDGQLEVEVPENEAIINEIEEEDDDVIFEEEVIHPPNSKKPRCEPSTSSAAGSSESMMHSGKAVVIQDLEELEEIEYVIENDPSGCCKDISAVPVQDLRLLLTTCPVCKKRYIKMKTASKCLRTHGLRRCWICLKLVPSNGQDFLQHNLKHIIPGTEGKVSCSFCRKQFGYNIGINTHMGNYHFSRLLETTTKDLDKTKTLTAKQMKTLETLNRGLANEKVPKNTFTTATNEQNMNIEEIIINEDSEEVETISSDGDDPDFVPADSDLELIDDEDRKEEHQQPKTRHSQTADQRRANIPSTATTSSAAAQNPPLVKPPPPNLGRVLLEIKEIDGQIYNIYGLINPTSTDPKNKFSKVIAIRNTDVQARANLELMKKQIKQKQ